MIYQSPIPSLGEIGKLRAVLARPDMIVSQSRWNLYLPDDYYFGRPAGNMRFISKGTYFEQDLIKQNIMQKLDQRSTQFSGPIGLTIPETGMHYAFEKLYANQNLDETYVFIPYISGEMGVVIYLLAILGALLLLNCLGEKNQAKLITFLGLGFVLTLLPPIYLGTSAEYTLIIAIVTILIAVSNRHGISTAVLGRLQKKQSSQDTVS